MKFIEIVEKFKKKLSIVNILLFSFFINLLITSKIIYNYDFNFSVNIKNVIYFFEFVSIFIAWLILYIYRNVMKALSRKFLNGEVYSNVDINTVLLPLTVISFIFGLYFLIMLKPINLVVLYLIILPFDFFYLSIINTIFLYKNREGNILISIIISIVSFIIAALIAIVIIYELSDTLVEYYYILDQIKSLGSGKWGIG